MPILARPLAPILPKRIAMVPGVGMRGYIKGANRGFGLIRGGRRRGLGDTCLQFAEDGSCVSWDFSTPAAPASASSAPSPFTTALAQSLPGVIGSGMNILGNVVAPQVQYRGPGGIMYSAPAGSPAGSSLPSSIAALGTTSYLPLLLIGGGLLVVVMLVGKK